MDRASLQSFYLIKQSLEIKQKKKKKFRTETWTRALGRGRGRLLCEDGPRITKNGPDLGKYIWGGSQPKPKFEGWALVKIQVIRLGLDPRLYCLEWSLGQINKPVLEDMGARVWLGKQGNVANNIVKELESEKKK